jgi:hypothetical protein
LYNGLVSFCSDSQVRYSDVSLGVFDVVSWDRVVRGSNSVVVEGKLDVAAQALDQVSDLFSALLGGQHVVLVATLASSSNPIVAQGLAGVLLNTSLAAPPLPLLAPNGIDIVSCSLVPSVSAQAGSEVVLTVKLKVTIINPLGTQASLYFNVTYRNDIC